MSKNSSSTSIRLKWISTIMVTGIQRFVAKNCLKTADVGWTGDNFNRLFLNKVEKNVPEAKLAVYQLEQASLDAFILAELRDRAEVPLAYLFGLLEKQSKGEGGVLLTNGCANIFYIRGDDNNLWNVAAYWYSNFGSWRVDADSVEDPFKWLVGSQVFSHDS